MDNKGFISVEYLFSLFIVLIIACGVLFYASASISSSFNIDDTLSHRMILDSVADEISQVNSNGVGYSKTLKLPRDKGYFEITVYRSKLTMEYDGKIAETLLPLAFTDSKYTLVSGRSYTVTKTDRGVEIT